MMEQEWKEDGGEDGRVAGGSGGGDAARGWVRLEIRNEVIFTFSASSLTSRVPRLDGLSTRKRLSRFSQSVDM